MEFRPERLRALRDERGLDQSQLARRANVHPSYIYRLENGEVPNVSAVIVARLARTLGTSMEYLLGITDQGGGFLDSRDQRPNLSESSEKLALRIDALPADRIEIVRKIMAGIVSALEESASSAGVQRKRLLMFFDALPEPEQDALLAAAERMRWTKDDEQALAGRLIDHGQARL